MLKLPLISLLLVKIISFIEIHKVHKKKAPQNDEVPTFEVGDRIKLGFEGTTCVEVTCNEFADNKNHIFY